jgi:probable phosphoglycerate mutase
VEIDAVYGSDLLRTHITASAVYVPKNLPFRPLPLLREICLGKWEQMSWGEIDRQDHQMYMDFNQKPHLWQVEGAESFAVVRDRMLAAIRQIAAENPGKTVAATSHGAALRTLLGTLEGKTLEGIGSTGHGDNTAVSLLEVEGDTIRVVFRDDNSHVPEELSTFRRQSWYKADAATAPGLWFKTLEENETGKVVDGMLDETAVGRVSMEKEGGKLRLSEFEVFPRYRGQRYGVQLLGQAVQYARRKGLEDLVITVPEKYAGYFVRYGFVQTGSSDAGMDLQLDIRLVIRPIP